MAEARRGVWRLLQGDRRANLLAILEQPAPPESDEVLFKIHTLLRLGFPVEVCLDGVASSRADLVVHDHD